MNSADSPRTVLARRDVLVPYAPAGAKTTGLSSLSSIINELRTSGTDQRRLFTKLPQSDPHKAGGQFCFTTTANRSFTPFFYDVLVTARNGKETSDLIAPIGAHKKYSSATSHSARLPRKVKGNSLLKLSSPAGEQKRRRSECRKCRTENILF